MYRSPDISTRRGQDSLPEGKDPHFKKIAKGLSVGLYKPPTGNRSWVARFRHDGKYRTRAFDQRKVTTYQEAVQAATEFAKEVEAGEVPTREEKAASAKGRQTVKELVYEYLTCDEMKTAKGDRYSSWYYTSERLTKCYVFPTLGDRQSKSITSLDIDDLQVQLRQKVSAETVNRAMVTFRASLNWAQKRGYLISPTKGSRLLEEAQSHEKANTKEYFTRKERDAFLQAADEPLRAICQFMDMFGARAATARRVRVRDCHVDSRLKQPYVLMHTYKGNRFSGKSWKFPLGGKRLEFIREQVKGKQPDDYLFTTEKGLQWSEANLAKAIRLNRDAAGLDANFQQLTWRHCCIQDFVHEGVSTLKAAKLFGTSEKFIIENYTASMEIDPMEIPEL